MPLYEYECQSCHKRVEKIQSFSAEPLKTCSFCGGTLERLISASAIQFKGSGWYVTDYARSGRTSAASKESNDAKDSKESKDSKSESSPASSGDGPKATTPAATPAAPKSGD
ncbi:MAG: FmdB family zinc ribbon protein [Terriglobales bacterium]